MKNMLRSGAGNIRIVLHPGEYAVGDETCRMRTLLGSCVAITLWHPVRKVGAMCHFLLPTQGKRPRGKPNGRYGDEALELMLSDLQQRGIPAAECQAKIFGGGKIFLRQDDGGGGASTNVGRKNGEEARRMLLAKNIPIVSESLFGMGYRQIVFDLRTGDVWSRQAHHSAAKTRHKHQEPRLLLESAIEPLSAAALRFLQAASTSHSIWTKARQLVGNVLNQS